MKNVGKLEEKIANHQFLFGQDCQNIDFDSFEKPVHKNITTSIAALKQKAMDAGFSLAIASGYRDFVQQLTIWNQKVSGQRPVLDKNELPIDITRISKTQLLFSILRWSALPGASRHHWGTDFDVYDLSAIDENYQLQLTVQETEKNGPFESFYCWLNKILQDDACEFFRPYSQDLGGVSPEPWHLSHKAESKLFEGIASKDLLKAFIERQDILLKQEILSNFDDIYSRFIVVS